MSPAQAAKYSGLNVDARGGETPQHARISQGVVVPLCQKIVNNCEIDVFSSLIKIMRIYIG